ncbi:MAG TPA: cation:proton antiporter [Acidimicrobiia bacterium]|nr:cation:proton antiporter [Acidimicrobiia bacterium]
MDPTTLSTVALIAAVATIAPLLSEASGRKVPSVVLELVAGIIIGPQVLALAVETPTVRSLAGFGLCFLFFMAGYEIEFAEIRGRPLDLAAIGWLVSLLVAAAVAGVLLVTGFTISELLIALALTTTALGTLLPMLADADILHTRFGAYILAIGGAGEFLPVVAIALFFSGDSPYEETLLLLLFIALATGAVAMAIRPTPPRVVELLGRTVDSSSQLPIRIAVLLIALLVWVASELGLDVLLGAFAAGVVARLANQGEQAHVIEQKLSGVAFGVFVPIFFVVSGMGLDIDSFRERPLTLLRVPLFLALFLLVRGIPVLLLYRRDVHRSQLFPLALLSATALPIVVAITEIGVDSGHMRPANAAALVGAAILSVLVFPSTAFGWMRRHPVPPDAEVAAPADEPTEVYEDEADI